jgi:hypothetical protein
VTSDLLRALTWPVLIQLKCPFTVVAPTSACASFLTQIYIDFHLLQTETVIGRFSVKETVSNWVSSFVVGVSRLWNDPLTSTVLCPPTSGGHFTNLVAELLYQRISFKPLLLIAEPGTSPRLRVLSQLN